jgi:hypothetical protein
MSLQNVRAKIDGHTAAFWLVEILGDGGGYSVGPAQLHGVRSGQRQFAVARICRRVRRFPPRQGCPPSAVMLYEDLLKRDKLSLDLFWIKDKSNLQRLPRS